MTFQELKAAYLHLDYEDFTNKILINLQDGLKNTAVSELQTREDHEDYLQLLNSFRSSIAANDRLHGKNFIKQLTSMLSTGEDGVYDNSLRYIFELIQNVDDCDYQDPLNASLQIKFSENSGRIILKYNETGFTPLNIFAVTGIAEAAKIFKLKKYRLVKKELVSNPFLAWPTAYGFKAESFRLHLIEMPSACPFRFMMNAMKKLTVQS